VQISERRDARRLIVALAAAIVVHVALYFGIPFLTSLDTAPLPDYGPIVVTLEEPAAAVEPLAPRPAPAPEPIPEPTPEPTPVAAARPAPAPVARPAPGPAPAAGAAPKLAVDAGAVTAARRTPGTSSFTQSGPATGISKGAAAESIVSGPPPVILPAVGSTTPGSGEQRSGQAVTLSGRPATGSGTLDTRKLDSSLAQAGTSGGTSAAAASGTSTSRAASDIEWENPDAAKGRELLSAPLPRLPDWVKEQGLDLEVRIAFTVNAEGLVTAAQVAQGSGYPDVDDACLVALRNYRFSTAAGAKALKGSRAFSTRLR
jgi:TonB family protein